MNEMGERKLALPEDAQGSLGANRFRRLLVLGSLLVLALWSGCGGSSSPTEPSDQRPAWLTSLIARIESEPVTNPPSSIFRYRYRGGTVYFRPSRCCDVPGEVFDAAGSLVCNPDGGISGSGDGRCADFFSARSAEQMIYQDPRR